MLESRLHARERRGKNAQPLHVFPQGTSVPPATETALQDRATQSNKILPKSPVLTIASSRRGCHYTIPLKMMKNGVFYFGISSFVSEIFKFLFKN